LGIEKLTDKQDKQDKIVGMFDDIASTYDLANRVLSFGIDIQWRKKGCDKAFEILGQKELAQVTEATSPSTRICIKVASRRDFILVFRELTLII